MERNFLKLPAALRNPSYVHSSPTILKTDMISSAFPQYSASEKISCLIPYSPHEVKRCLSLIACSLHNVIGYASFYERRHWRAIVDVRLQLIEGVALSHVPKRSIHTVYLPCSERGSAGANPSTNHDESRFSLSNIHDLDVVCRLRITWHKNPFREGRA